MKLADLSRVNYNLLSLRIKTFSNHLMLGVFINYYSKVKIDLLSTIEH